MREAVHRICDPPARQDNPNTAHVEHLSCYSCVTGNVCLHQPPSDYHLFGSLERHLGQCRFHSNEFNFDSGGRVVSGVGLRPLACWNCGFESRWGHRYLSLANVLCGQRSLRRADPSSRGVLPNVDVIECDQVPH